MKTLRAIHLYLGCLFAPLLLVFAITGIWQRASSLAGPHMPSLFTRSMSSLSTLHTGRSLKLGGTLSSDVMTCLVLAMSLSLILTIVLGVVMALRFGHRQVALACLVIGVVVPLSVCVLTYVSQKNLHSVPLTERMGTENSKESSAVPADARP